MKPASGISGWWSGGPHHSRRLRNAPPGSRNAPVTGCSPDDLRPEIANSPRSVMRSRSACARTLANQARTLTNQERDLHDHLELGHPIVLNHALKLLDPHGLDVADGLGCTLDGLPDRILKAL